MKIDPIIPIWLMAIFSVAIIALKRKGIVPYVRQIVIALLLFVINLRIMVPNGQIEVEEVETNAYVLFVIDNTVSMYANDYDAAGTTRREAIQNDCAHIIESYPGAHYSIISFANEAMLASPYTTNAGYEESLILSMQPVQSYYARGTSLNTAHDLMLSELKRTQEDNPGAYVIVYFISDGEITNGDSLQSFADIAEYIDDGAVLGYGTRSGGKMYAPTFFGDDCEVIYDENYNEAVSVLDESNLNRIAGDLGITYIHMTDTSLVDGNIDSAKNHITEIGTETSETEGFDDIYYFFAIPLALLLIWEMFSMRQNRSHKRKKGSVRADEPQA